MSANFKVLFLGEATVGKTALSHRFTNHDFIQNYSSTIGLGYMCMRRNNILIDLWDTAGQERYAALIGLYYRGTNIALMVYDLSNMSTLDRVEHYLEKLLEYNYVHDISKIFVIGNKLDLINQYALEQIKYKVKNRFDKTELYEKMVFFYVSAKTNDGIVDLVNNIVSECERLKLITKEPIVDKEYAEEPKKFGLFSFC